ncbi:sulfurtransferase [Zwartia sp.]|uniref:sulfurtransferase n=1 Tax=Zwartia sp. TaxID=2978004 RepID=UPI002720B353|nr:sulfurtransferase [Zwartia sp.]MDO9023013.1 sulfurtransferase [Zwartia sp.]
MKKIAALFLGLLFSVGVLAAEPLLSAQTVQASLTAKNTAIIDIRDPKSYAAGHITGALSAPYGTWRGPSTNPGELPAKDKLTQLVQRLGLTPETHVIVTSSGKDDTDFGAAARVYWTLKVLGLQNLSVLNGGLKAWQAAGYPLDTKPGSAVASTFVPTINQDMIATREEVIAKVQAGKAQLVDARPVAFFDGSTRHTAAKVPGTLKGAVNVEHSKWFEPNSTLVVSASEAKKLVASTSVNTDQDTVSFCNTGHWAATNWFVLSELVGQKNVKLYAGSMVDWTQADGALPMDNVPNRLKQLYIDAQLWLAK